MKRTSLLALLPLLPSILLAADAPLRYAPARKLCDLANPAIDESSGLACSRRSPDILWTHNDSGDQPRLYAFNRKGEHLATVAVTGATARDWEDLASFTRDGKPYLLVADVGDNMWARRFATLYVVPEPALDPTKRNVVAAARVETAIEFTYEGGPQNCEAVAVDVAGQAVYAINKVQEPSCQVFRLPLRPNPPGKPWVAKEVATLAIPTVTAMDLSPDGRRAIVLSFLKSRERAYEYARRPDETWAAAFARTPRLIELPPLRQGEAICYGADGQTLYLTSEKTPAPLIEVPIARGMAKP